MPLLEISKGLVDVGTALLGVGDKLRAQDEQARERTAKVLDATCKCLESIAEHARAREWDALTGRCEELGIYLENFLTLEQLPGLVGKDPIDLLNKLAEAVKARRGLALATNLLEGNNDSQREALHQIQRALGTFRAATTLLRGVPPKRSISRHRLFIAGFVFLALVIGGSLILFSTGRAERTRIVKLDPTGTTSIGPFKLWEAKQFRITGQWSPGQHPEHSYWGPEGSPNERLNNFRKWSVLIELVDPVNGQLLHTGQYQSSVDIAPNLVYRFRMNDEPEWAWDNTSDPDSPMRVIIE